MFTQWLFHQLLETLSKKGNVHTVTFPSIVGHCEKGQCFHAGSFWWWHWQWSIGCKLLLFPWIPVPASNPLCRQLGNWNNTHTHTHLTFSSKMSVTEIFRVNLKRGGGGGGGGGGECESLHFNFIMEFYQRDICGFQTVFHIMFSHLQSEVTPCLYTWPVAPPASKPYLPALPSLLPSSLA